MRHPPRAHDSHRARCPPPPPLPMSSPPSLKPAGQSLRGAPRHHTRPPARALPLGSPAERGPVSLAAPLAQACGRPSSSAAQEPAPRRPPANSGSRWPSAVGPPSASSTGRHAPASATLTSPCRWGPLLPPPAHPRARWCGVRAGGQPGGGLPLGRAVGCSSRANRDDPHRLLSLSSVLRDQAYALHAM
jgi:hypothetical protein